MRRSLAAFSPVAMLGSLLLAAIGCGNAASQDTSKKLAGFDPGPAPQNGIQILLPIVKDLQPGTDNEICTWTDITVTANTDVKAVQGIQAPAGHHTILFATKKFQPAGTTRPCSDDDMATFRFAAGAGGEGQNSRNEAPGNLVFRIDAGSQIVINHHYINASPTPKDSQSAMNIFYADPKPTNVPVSSMAFLNTVLKIPPGNSSLDISCKMPVDADFFQMFPHMHAYGTHITMDRTGSATDHLFDVMWSPTYQFHPPAITRDPAMPFTVKKDDVVKVHCEWANPTDKQVTFGVEMCVGFGAVIDSKGIGNLDCDDGQWGTF